MLFRQVLHKAKLWAQHAPLRIAAHETRLTGKGLAGFGADGQLWVRIEHTARNVHCMGGGDRGAIVGCGQGWPPIDDLRQPLLLRRKN